MYIYMKYLIKADIPNKGRYIFKMTFPTMVPKAK